MKTGVVESVQGNGNFTTDHGTFYSFEYHLDNGDFGTANHKTDIPKYKIGDTVHYETQNSDYGVKLKFVNPDFQNNTPQVNSGATTPNTPVKSNDMVTGIALKYATMVKCAYIAKGADYSEDQLKTELELMKRLMS